MLLINDTNTKSANTLDTIFAEMTNIATGNYGITLNNLIQKKSSKFNRRMSQPISL